ncbi:transcription initiation factor IIB [Haloplanus sp.]|uniref:transcription initiation factor IIB n=1 Tax=Haloplanus sp. TaxID=1961696 RepID=UPI002607149F|nr:transcription initiation factor IIB [Haloplanus sp.]
MSQQPRTLRETGGEQRTTTENREEAESAEHACPECDAALVTDESRGETVCEACGLVVKENEIDHGPEWRAFDSSERAEKSRVGAPTTKLLHDDGLSSVIDWQDRDAKGRTIDGSKRRKLQRLRTWDERFRSKNAQERNLKQALGEVDRMSSALGLPESVRETASVVYRKALEDDLLRGRSIEAMATASLYAAARQASIPRSLDEFEPVSRVGRKEFSRAYRYIVRELGLAIEPANPLEYLPRFASDLDLNGATKSRARSLLEEGMESGVHSGKSPVGLAAAALYAASILEGEKVTQKEVCEVSDVSEVTVRNRYTELLEAGTDPDAARSAA